LITLGRYAEAVDCPPHNEQPNVLQQIEEKLKWTGAPLAVGWKSEAERRLRQAQELVAQSNVWRPEAGQLAERF
jgi:hypothetical protein